MADEGWKELVCRACGRDEKQVNWMAKVGRTDQREALVYGIVKCKFALHVIYCELQINIKM